ncbi:hypothetical protein LG634_00150 [Streptomyces bambusae]|uniref:hypothetical protein n=1 Tax=Streptomyces bambusae TaxID=1550616 RepID=UPI001CFC9914|nr:hypothetical protein [Streptomyces bambusae]MCB5163267.1 hypothetical protein [Streptomyces bambusae]
MLIGTRRTRVIAGSFAASTVLLVSAAWAELAGGDARMEHPVREITTAERELLQTAEQMLVQSCMQQQGFRYWPVDRHPIPEYREFPYVVDDVNWARTYGYGAELERRMKEMDASSPNKKYVAALTPDRRRQWLQTYHGSGSGWLKAKLPRGGVLSHSDAGCASKAQRLLYQDLQGWYQARESAIDRKGLKQDRVVADDRFAASTEQWARCMRRSGHAYTSPADIREALEKTSLRTEPKQQVTLAVAEAVCAEESGLARTSRKLDRHYAEVLAGQYRADTDLKLRLEREALPRAQEMVRQATDSGLSPERSPSSSP